MNDIWQTSGQLFTTGISLRLPVLLLLCVNGLQNAGATDIVVANNADGGNGTLRQAIQFNESLGGGNTIVFSNIVTGTITLTNVLGELLITKDVTIIGPGANVLAISGNNAHRVFHLTNNANVNISGLTVTFGYDTNFNQIGAGGILQDSGVLDLSDCHISRNVSVGGGGGIRAAGTTRAIRCTFFKNDAPSGLVGGGIVVFGTFQGVNCTISENSQGGILSYSGGTLSLTNCSVSRNTTTAGGIGAAGIWILGGNATIRNSIIAGNTAPPTVSPDCYGSFTSGGFNLIGVINGSTGWGALGDQVGTTNAPLNPLLGPLQDNGGATPTLAPLPGSPVIDQGNVSGVLTDQRGQTRPYTNSSVSSIPLGGDHGDIGAVEISSADALVTNTNNAGGGSLRNAILMAPPGVAITFASNVTGTIANTTGQLLITNSLNIQGPSNRSIVISGNLYSRVFHIINSSTVNISSLTIANGDTTGAGTAGAGGGILNDSGCVLTLNNCAVLANVSDDNGGGIANNGRFTAYNCTFSRNRASQSGGAIYTYAGPVTLRNCTIVSNTAISSSGTGGGILNYSLVAGTSNNISGTIVAGNSAAFHSDVIGVFTSGGYNLIGKIDYSTQIIGGAVGVTTSGLTNNINHDLVGSLASPTNAMVGALQDNGGPTLTHALKAGSPAIDSGISNGLLTDQRAAPRPFDFATIANAAGGDGSDIGAFELGSPTLNIQKFTTNAVISWPFYYGDFTLQSVTNIAASNSWANVPGIPVVVANQYVLTNSPLSGNKFYRLKNN